MRIAVASGKGGTGKTSVSVSLALASEIIPLVLDCDVEEPNCALYLKPEILSRTEVTVPVPSVSEEVCDSCGECGSFCQYHAIVSLRTKPLVFPDLCHGCGGCALVCPRGAITEAEKPIGHIEVGMSNGIVCRTGTLLVGQAMAAPLIKAVKRQEGGSADPRLAGGTVPKPRAGNSLTIVDCPPGTACPFRNAVMGADYVILVTEPTPFGLHDLSLAAEAIGELGIPFGVVVNRMGTGDSRVQEYCAARGISLIGEIGEDRKIAEASSRGKSIVETVPELLPVFRNILSRVSEESGASREGES